VMARASASVAPGPIFSGATGTSAAGLSVAELTGHLL
jgi:hypothetical protein